MLTPDASRKYFANPAALPTMPEVAHELLTSFRDENLSLVDLARLIGRDQSLSVKLLRMANSARYSPRHTINTLQDAAASVGMTAMRDLALAACVSGAFPVAQGFDRLRFWRQCLATSGYARVMAQACQVDPDTANLAGLVMRTGELLMLMADPEGVAQAESLAHLPDSLLDHEVALLHCHHLDVTAELARRWHFPDELVTAIAGAADPMAQKPFCRLAAVLRMASVMSDAGDRNLPAITTLLETQGELVAHVRLDLDWLASHLQPYADLTAGVDQMVH